jgi:alpha-mannosidase
MRGELLPPAWLLLPCKVPQLLYRAVDTVYILRRSDQDTISIFIPHSIHHGRRISPQHAGAGSQRLPQAGGWSRRQADPQHLPEPPKTVSGWWTISGTESYRVSLELQLLQPQLHLDPQLHDAHTSYSKLTEAVASGTDWVKLSVYSPPNLSRPLFKEATSHAFHPTKVGESFGPSWSTHWFKVQVTVPKHMLDKEHLEFVWDANNEGLIWTQDGHTVHGLTGGGERTQWILPKAFRDGKEHTFYIEMACNGIFGNAPGGDSIQPPAPDKYYTLHTAEVQAVNLEARALYFDFWEIGDAAREFPSDSTQAHDAQQVGNRIMDTFIAGNGSQESIKAARKIAAEYVGKDVDSHKVYETDQEAIVHGIGYCHIDTCWLWPFDETKRKVNRSWSNQCDLIERYPELRFCCSQAQQYKWLEQYYPSTFDRVKKKVKEGSFQPIGGSWVEHDTNLPGGESLIRQFLYGQRYFESKFGQRCRTFWLPDTFGYSTQLPQICRISGMTRFLTQKLSWNNINNFPHTTFNWVALDNSQVVCHMPPSETYTCEANFGDVKRSVTQHKSLDQDKSSLIVFGKGDGGGGPTWQQLEKLRRCRGISDTSGLLPRVKLGDSADDFFDRLEKKIENGTELVTWYGELYFELHRGTYTTQSNNKRNNRKSEIMLRDIEYLATLATIKNSFGKKSSYKYPKKDIDDMWENVLLCQFHDCLPGSSIEICYDDSDRVCGCSCSQKPFTDSVRSTLKSLPPARDCFLMPLLNLDSTMRVAGTKTQDCLQ